MSWPATVPRAPAEIRDMAMINRVSTAQKLTPTQKKALAAAFKKGGAWFAHRGSNAGGAYRRMCARLAGLGLLETRAPYAITPLGLLALRDIWAARWARHGCMAYQLDLEAVEAAIERDSAAD